MRAQAQASIPTPKAGTQDAAVSVRELQIPTKARQSFDSGIECLRKGEPEAGLTHFKKALQALPDYYEAHHAKGVAEMRLGRYEDAMHSFQAAIELSQGRYARAQFGYAMTLWAVGKVVEAEPIVRRGLATDPDIPEGWVVLAILLLTLQRPEEAEMSARQALLLPQSEAHAAYLVLSDIHADRADFRAQVQDLETYLRLEPSDPRKKSLLNTLAAARTRAATQVEALHDDPRELRSGSGRLQSLGRYPIKMGRVRILATTRDYLLCSF